MSTSRRYLFALSVVAACRIPDEHFAPLHDAGNPDAGGPQTFGVAFEAAELFPAPGTLVDIAIADFNGDGHPDVVGVTGTASSAVYLWKGKAGGQLAPPTPVGSAGNTAAAIVAMDVNHDGKQDLVIAMSGANAVGVMLGHGDNMFDAVVAYPTPATPTRIEVADLNNDRQPDLIVSVSIGWAVLLNTGAGFGAATAYPATLPRVKGVVIADWNNDALPDFIGFAADNSETGFGVPYLQQPGGGFVVGSNVSIAGSVSFLTSGAAADLNGDGKLDLIAGTSNGLSVLLGNGNGTFQNKVIYGPSNAGQHALVADWNGDGRLDVIVGSNSNFDGLYLYIGHGDGTFDTGVVVGGLGDNTQAIHAVDMDGDTHLDCVTLSRNGSPIAVVGGTGTGLRGATTFGSTVQFSDLATADITGDGKVDLVGIGSMLDVLVGNGVGGFSATPTAVTGSALALGDFSGDGIADLVTNRSVAGISIYANSGGGSFGNPATLDPGESVDRVAVADLNGDLKGDVVAISSTTGTPVVMLNIGNSNFATPVSYAIGDLDKNSQPDTAQALAVIDVTGDNRPDILVITPAGYAGVLVNKGDGTFAPGVGYLVEAGSDVFDITAGDVTGDGKADLVAVTRNGSTVYILRNKGDNTFDVPVKLPLLGRDARRIRIADVDKDGVADLVASCTSGEVDVIVGLGLGSFGQPRAFASGGDSEALALGDFNGDGRPDIATGTSGAHILINRKP